MTLQQRLNCLSDSHEILCQIFVTWKLCSVHDSCENRKSEIRNLFKGVNELLSVLTSRCCHVWVKFHVPDLHINAVSVFPSVLKIRKGKKKRPKHVTEHSVRKVVKSKIFLKLRNIWKLIMFHYLQWSWKNIS